jgi:hypothetical protein
VVAKRNSGIWEKQGRANQLTADRAALLFSAGDMVSVVVDFTKTCRGTA